MKKKIFAVSDIHNNYTALKRSLGKAGYDETNDNYMLIVCGDCFDRRPGDALAIYNFLKPLTDSGKVIVTLGNHCDMLIKYLDGTSILPFNYLRNGLNQTLGDFLHQTSPFETWCIYQDIEQPTYDDFAEWLEIARKYINKEYPELLPWLESLPYYYETKSHIFTHGMINGSCEDWKNPPEGWDKLIWSKPEDYTKPIVNTDKTIVTGHIHTDLVRELYSMKPQNNKIFIRPDGKVICLDTCTVLTNRVNVLVIEEDVV